MFSRSPSHAASWSQQVQKEKNLAAKWTMRDSNPRPVVANDVRCHLRQQSNASGMFALLDGAFR